MSCVRKLQPLLTLSRWWLQPDTTPSCWAWWVTPCASCQPLWRCDSCWWRATSGTSRCVTCGSTVRASWTSRMAGPARSWWAAAGCTSWAPPSSTCWVTSPEPELTACTAYCGPLCNRTTWSEASATSPATTFVSSKCWWVEPDPRACAAPWPWTSTCRGHSCTRLWLSDLPAGWSPGEPSCTANATGANAKSCCWLTPVASDRRRKRCPAPTCRGWAPWWRRWDSPSRLTKSGGHGHEVRLPRRQPSKTACTCRRWWRQWNSPAAAGSGSAWRSWVRSQTPTTTCARRCRETKTEPKHSLSAKTTCVTERDSERLFVMQLLWPLTSHTHTTTFFYLFTSSQVLQINI